MRSLSRASAFAHETLQGLLPFAFELADALLFGAVAGAYTGCNTDKEGLIEGAGDGILFLDEVGDLPPRGSC